LDLLVLPHVAAALPLAADLQQGQLASDLPEQPPQADLDSALEAQSPHVDLDSDLDSTLQQEPSALAGLVSEEQHVDLDDALLPLDLSDLDFDDVFFAFEDFDEEVDDDVTVAL
jgi:hypothetical protein